MRRCLSCGAVFEADAWRCPACGFEPERRQGYICFAPGLMSDATAFDVESFIELAKLEDRSFWFPLRNSLILWALEKYFPSARSFFELGCGTGVVLKAIAERTPDMELSGGDVYVEGLAHAEQRLGTRASLMQVDGTNLPFRDAFDVVGAFDVIEHIDDDVAAMRELYRATKPGGGALVIVPRHMFLWSAVDDLAQHKRRYSGGELRQKMVAAGFTVVRQLTFGALTLPLQYLSRRHLQTKGPRLSDVLELSIPAYQQVILEALLRLDQIPVRLGVNYPFGASLMTIARKL